MLRLKILKNIIYAYIEDYNKYFYLKCVLKNTLNKFRYLVYICEYISLAEVNKRRAQLILNRIIPMELIPMDNKSIQNATTLNSKSIHYTSNYVTG